MRLSAVLTLALLVIYQVMRMAAARCSGGACDWFIPLSLLLPISVLVTVAVTGALAISAIRRSRDIASGRRWLIAIVTCTVVGVAGPLLAVAVLRDSPDVLVPVATVLFLLTPVGVLAYWFGGNQTKSRAD